jgi:hypothetical protein
MVSGEGVIIGGDQDCAGDASSLCRVRQGMGRDGIQRSSGDTPSFFQSRRSTGADDDLGAEDVNADDDDERGEACGGVDNWGLPNRGLLNLGPILGEIQGIKEATKQLRDNVEIIRHQVQQEYAYFHQALHEEKYRYQKLEDQMNDLTELHQAEMLNLKQEITSMEDKIEYQNQERIRDLQDAIENSQTRICKIEHSQQLVSLEGLQPTSSLFALKAFNVLIIFLQCALVIISTLAQALIPFFKTRVRVLTSLLLFVLVIYLFRHRGALSLFLDAALDRLGLFRQAIVTDRQLSRPSVPSIPAISPRPLQADDR